MGGLLPLCLKVMDTRRSSPSPPPSIPLPPIPPTSMCRPRSSILLLSPLPTRPPKSTFRPQFQNTINLKISPCTEADWREVMEEVKVLYLKRQYKQCSTCCTQVLESIKDPYRVHPLYQIFLSFFAASSLEITSRSLHPSSSTKLPLLQQSLTYYQKAESHMEYAAFSTDPTIVQAVRQTRHDSISSSIRSSIDSIFSQTSLSSTASSVANSPPSTSNLTSALATHKRTQSEINITSRHQKPQKKVSFSLELPRLFSPNELELADDHTLLSCFPAPPCSTSPPSPPPSPDSIFDFLLSRALIRYRVHLSDLHNQLNYQIRSVERQIKDVQTSREAWRSNLSPAITHFSAGMEGVNGEEVKKVELRARIERLKQNGWKRERFDGRRYQDLCDKALGELD